MWKSTPLAIGTCLVSGWRLNHNGDLGVTNSGRLLVPRTPEEFIHDGNRNLDALVQASDSTVSARHRDGHFGEVLRASGPMALANPLRFSTK